VTYPISVSYARSLYPQALQSIYRGFREIVDTDLAQQKEPEIWDKLRQDAVAAQAIDIRSSEIAGDDFMVVPAKNATAEEKDLAVWMQDALGEIDSFKAAQTLAAHGYFRGRYYGFPENAVRHLQLGGIDEIPAQPWRVITRIKEIDKDRVAKLKEDGAWGWYLKSATGRGKKTRLTSNSPLVSIVWCDEERTLGYGWPAIRSAYFMWWAKMETLPLVLSGLERWAMGQIDIEIDERTSAGGDGRSAQDVMDEYIAQAKKHKGEHVFAHSSLDKVNFHAMGSDGNAIAMGWLDYCDNALRGYLYGSVLPLGGQEGVGSLARAEVEQSVAQSLIQADRDLKDEKMGGKLIRLLWDWNRDKLQRIFPNRPRMPKFVTTSKEIDDPSANAQNAEVALRAGIPLKKSEVYEKLGWTMPEDGDEVIEGSAGLDTLQGASASGGFGGSFR